jgi:hypothetical protein
MSFVVIQPAMLTSRPEDLQSIGSAAVAEIQPDGTLVDRGYPATCDAGRGYSFRSYRNVTFITPREGHIQVPARFITDPDQMRVMAGRFNVHARTVEDEARRM